MISKPSKNGYPAYLDTADRSVPDSGHTGRLNLHGEVASNSETDIAVDSIPGSYMSTYNLTLNDDNFAMINSASDSDWFAFFMDAGVTYSFDMNGAPGLDAFLQVYSFAASPLVSNDNASPDTTNARVTYTPTTSGIYFVAASSSNGATGQYDIAWHDQVGHSPSTASTIAVGASLTGLVETAGDQDWYAVTMTAGTHYELTVNGYGGHPLSSPYALIYDANQNLIDVSADNGGAATVNFTPATTGTYYLSASNYNDFSHVREGGGYTVAVTINDDIYTGDTSTTGQIAPGGSVTSAIDTDGDTDWFAVTVEAGYIYTWDMTGSGGEPLSDPFLSLYNWGGGLVASDDDSGPGTSPHLSFYATYGGTFYISAEAFANPSPYINHGGYTLTMGPKVAATEDKVGDYYWDASSLTVGARTSGRIDRPGDHDVYAVTLVAGQGYDFDVTGVDGLNTSLRVYDSNGQVIAQNDDVRGSVNAHLDFEALTSGTYYISAETSGNNSYGNYSIKVSNGDRPLLTDSIDWGSKLTVTDGVVKVYFAGAGEIFDGVTSEGWNAYETQQAMAALAVYSNYINLTFVQTTNAAEAQFKLVTATGLEDNVLAYMNPPGTANAGVGVFATDTPAWSAAAGGPLDEDGLGFSTFIHEFGHGLGLAHPFDNGGTSTVMTGVFDTYDYYGYGYQNQGIYTIMSYNDGWPGQPAYYADYSHGYGVSPMAMDIALLQKKYGAASYNNGNDVYEIREGNFNQQTNYLSIWDTGGTDTLSAENNAYGVVHIDLRAATMYYTGETSGGAPTFVVGRNGGITIAQGVKIENAIGSRNDDIITGNDYANVIKGLTGSDTINGLGGNDSIFLTSSVLYTLSNVDGGDGIDTLTLDMPHSAFTGTFNGTTLSIMSGSNFVGVTNVESLIFTDGTYAFNKVINAAPTLTGSLMSTVSGAGQHVITASDLGALDYNDDVITYYVQKGDKLGTTDFSGATNHGSIFVNGVAANTFTAAQLAAGQVVFKQDGVVDVPVAFTVAAYDGIAYSSAVKFEFVTAYDHGAYQFIAGTSAADTLDLTAFGGNRTGDILAGYVGNDTYIVSSVTTKVVEGADNGDDTVKSSVAYTLGANIERLVLTGAANINGTGNADSNWLTGNDGNNKLDGRGGADIMAGGAGNDTYYVDNWSDQVVETVGIIAPMDTGGIDTVISYMDYWYAGQFIENILLAGSATSAYGNELGNTLTGNALDNYLQGYWGDDILNGGLGADTLVGDWGNDTYYVDNIGDSVLEAGYDDIDQVFASINYTLTDTVENLTLTGTTNLNGTGNVLANTLVGNAGNNILNGLAGADIMSGGLGNDTYYVDNIGDVVTELNAGGTDKVNASVSYTLGSYIETLVLTGTSNLYGTGNSLANILVGNAGNNSLDGGLGADAMYGGAGNDIYVVDTSLDVITEMSNQGEDTVYATASYTLSANIEALYLLGDGNINGTGNTGNNILFGTAGNNVLNGGAGADVMVGGTGNDTYYVDNIGDSVREELYLSEGGIDKVNASISYTLGYFIENLVLTGTADINATGNGRDNILVGNAGNNRLDGQAGADNMAGGLGDDTYMLDSLYDVVTELNGQGIDRVFAGFTYTLGANVENLFLTGFDYIDGKGNALDNMLIGNSGKNTLNGGAGIDIMNGGDGDDTYIVDNIGDVVMEGVTGGNDTVFASISYSLGGRYVERLFLTGTANINASGNNNFNFLVGNDGNNIINGGGDADFMNGGNGDDTYYVDNFEDSVIEGATGGNDTIYSSISYSLGGRYVESLFLTGTANINAAGNNNANLLVGNDGNNVLNGGASADTMNGGKGNDTYYVDDAGDVVIEGSTGGNDTILSSLSWSLSGTYVETLTLQGTGNINASGNGNANTLRGNTGNNLINGGAGNDILTGGGGNDIFWFGAGSGVDTITDFSNDTINLNAYSHGVTNGAGIVIAQAGGNTTIDLGGGNIITLTGVTPTDLNGHIVW